MALPAKQIKRVFSSNLMLCILGVWFVSNLFSQMLFLGTYGRPYDGVSLLKSLGPVYYLVMSVEVLLWLWLVVFAITKGIKYSTRKTALDLDIGGLENLSKTSL